MGHHRPLFNLFLVFSSKQYEFYNKLMCKKCPALGFKLMRASFYSDDPSSNPAEAYSFYL